MGRISQLGCVGCALTGRGWHRQRGFFIYIFFKNVFLQKYIFGFTFYSFIPLPPGSGASGGLPPDGGRQGPICKLI